jgi:tripartite-type tricarboxylate transporter receptor subunit TctC
MMRRLFICLLTGAALAASTAQAQQQSNTAYPARQVRMVVPYPAGGPTDLIARILAQKLTERMRQSFYVENIAGASGALAAGQVAKTAPDGHTLLIVTNDFAVASVTNANLSYDPIKDFIPITIVAASPQVIAVNPSVPANNMKELITLIKANPEKYNYAGMSIGYGQLSTERLFKLGLKLPELVRVPFNGAAPAINSTLAGQTQIVMLGLPPVAPHLSGGKLRALAVSSSARAPAFPDIPTLRESGVTNQESELQIGVVAPAGTPPAVISALQKQIAETTALPDVKKTLDTLSFYVVASTPAAFDKQIKDDITTWGKVMKEANIPVN